MAANLTELKEGVENRELRLIETFERNRFADFFVHRSANGFVEIFLTGGEFDGVSEDRLGRKLSGDLVFCPAEDEGTEAIPKSDSVLFRLFFLDGVLVIRFKLIERAEIAGDEEAKEGPEFAKVILDRGAGEANTEIRL